MTHFVPSTVNTSTVTASSTTNTPSAISSSKSPIGGIAGGVAGAVVLLIGIIAGFAISRRRAHRARGGTLGSAIENSSLHEEVARHSPLHGQAHEQHDPQELHGEIRMLNWLDLGSKSSTNIDFMR